MINSKNSNSNIIFEVFFELNKNEKIKHNLKKIIKNLPKKIANKLPKRINLIFVNNQKIRYLNMQYGRKDKATDILSFNYNNKNCKNEFDNLGEIYISLPFLKDIAKKRNEPMDKIINTTFIHGIVHLAGYDHQKSKEAEEMEGMEKKLINNAVLTNHPN